MTNRLKYNILFALMITMIAFGSCKRTFLREELNNDPTSLDNPDPKVILPTAIANLAYYYGGDITRYDALITQQVAGGGNQWIAYQNYNFVNADFDNCWNALYTTTLNSLSKMEKYCKQKNLPHYQGISKVLSAFTYSILVDHWGNIPYTEALQAPEILQPKFDNGSTIYTSLLNTLTDAEVLLNSTNSGRAPGDDDLLFAGDIPSWIQFTHAIKARLYLHTKDYTNAKSELALANGIDAKFSFNSPSSGPMSQFNSNRAGDIVYMGSYMYNEMSTNGDARIYSYVDTTEDDLGVIFDAADQPIFLVSAMEQKFMEAEILARENDLTATATLQQAIDMSYAFAGGDTTGMAATWAKYPYNDADPLTDRLKAVMTQKYFAMFLQPEAFADWRRTGYPVLTPSSGSNVPRRYLYPTDELNTNSNTPKGVTLFTPTVFWDN